MAAGFPRVFDTYGVSLLQNIPAGSTAVMDELGYLEREAGAFLAQVRRVLTGPYHVLAAVKPADEPHMRDFRSLPGVNVPLVTPENREAQYVWARKMVKEELQKIFLSGY